jgi:hypothetical protein
MNSPCKLALEDLLLLCLHEEVLKLLKEANDSLLEDSDGIYVPSLEVLPMVLRDLLRDRLLELSLLLVALFEVHP